MFSDYVSLANNAEFKRAVEHKRGGDLRTVTGCRTSSSAMAESGV